ncbi:MAG TPA: Hsp20/alpha crystallin family protein [Burkholderiales bacterium]|nr:Hsp20/alpha crystallin family protein [Burkholderiales bacterium]
MANEVEIKQGGEMQKASPARMLSPLEDMERLFGSFFPRRWMSPFAGEWQIGENIPKIDVIERDEEIVLLAEVPGVDKKDLDVSMTDSSVTIKGKTNHRTETENANYCCSEIMHGAFSRTVSLPSEVNVEKAKAQFKDGMLEIDMPKTEKSRRRTLTLD